MFRTYRAVGTSFLFGFSLCSLLHNIGSGNLTSDEFTLMINEELPSSMINTRLEQPTKQDDNDSSTNATIKRVDKKKAVSSEHGKLDNINWIISSAVSVSWKRTGRMVVSILFGTIAVLDISVHHCH